MSLLTMIDSTAVWMCGDAPAGSIVLTSRIRLARNVRGRRFPMQASDPMLADLLREVFAFARDDCSLSQLHGVSLGALTQVERDCLVERYLTSQEHIQNVTGRGLLLDRGGRVSVLVNEEDHFRIQVISSGLQLESAFRLADSLDDRIDDYFGFAFSARYGYLTACPTNVGTGLRASVMMHLPALTLLDRVTKVVEAARRAGLTVRGVYGEGSNPDGSLFQISNQITLGLAEQQILAGVDAVARETHKCEDSAREELVRRHRITIEDHVCRAFGVLSHARRITTAEATNLLSALRLGHDLGMLRGIPRQRFNELLVLTRPANLQISQGRALDANERDIVRASILRNAMSSVTVGKI